MEKLTEAEFNWIINTLQHAPLASLYQPAIAKLIEFDILEKEKPLESFNVAVIAGSWSEFLKWAKEFGGTFISSGRKLEKEGKIYWYIGEKFELLGKPWQDVKTIGTGFEYPELVQSARERMYQTTREMLNADKL